MAPVHGDLYDGADTLCYRSKAYLTEPNVNSDGPLRMS